MDHRDRVETFLTDHPGRFYCNRCLSDEILVLTVGQVRRITGLLGSVPSYRQGKMICARCRLDRQSIAYGQEPPLPDSVEPVQHP